MRSRHNLNITYHIQGLYPVRSRNFDGAKRFFFYFFLKLLRAVAYAAQIQFEYHLLNLSGIHVNQPIVGESRLPQNIFLYDLLTQIKGPVVNPNTI